MTALLYHACAAADWQRAQGEGLYHGSAQDVADGFIHFSAALTIRASVARWLAGRADLLLLEVAADALGAALRWEPARDGALLPHLYAPLPVAAVRQSWPLPLRAGHHLFPDQIP
jgi:uncharacterized protein (DUF952 family)